MTIFIGGAWPYANGSLHIGHIASLLPGDILARYYRQKGEKVLYVSGSDCNGTPISVRANQEGVEPKTIADRYHQEFAHDFEALGFSYDVYTRTDADHHHKTVQELFLALQKNGHLYKKEVEQAYCINCAQFLPDRFVEGICPACGNKARGDQCDYCSAILEALELHDKKCKLCQHEPTVRTTEHFYFSLSSFQQQLEQLLKSSSKNETWRNNARFLTERYLTEGLRDRAVTRDLPVGVSVPIANYEDKKIYVWVEAVAGYYSASKHWAHKTGGKHEDYWNENTVSYYVHGKDNIPFHTIIWPALLLGLNSKALPDYILSNEYMTLERKKISTSQNYAVWIPDLIKKYHPDSIRYFLTINAPEKRDADFSWREFIYSHNSELLGSFGNFVNRTVKFISKYYSNNVEKRETSEEVRKQINTSYILVAEKIEAGEIKQALQSLFELIRYSNKYFDNRKPWIDIKEDEESCRQTIYDCCILLINIGQMLHPFLPFSSNKLKSLFQLEKWSWEYTEKIPAFIKDIEPLFERIDVVSIEEETDKIKNQTATS
ncbi:methionine--tRNA ligase [Niallia taxi]|uniref:methionine--tRNA ligase n=1 Tax=Niallia taxi TaxID=2499688 RepID=UPI003982887E